MKKNEDIFLLAFLWEEVIRLGFLPASTNEQRNWLLQYGKSLTKFWGLNFYNTNFTMEKGRLVTQITSPEMITFTCSITTISKFAVRFNMPEANMEWTHDMDGSYFSFPNRRFVDSNRPQKNNTTQSDVERVIDSLLVHPTPHQHIESPHNRHEIRIGGGLLNPFLYLFHLRIQLCPVEEKREAERIRLAKMFLTAIKSNKPVAANELMQVPD